MSEAKKNKSPTAGPRWDWPQVITELAEQRGMSIRSLAADMGMSHVYVSKVIRGELPASAKLKLAVWSRGEYDLQVHNLANLLLSDEAASALHEFEVQRGLARVNRLLEQQSLKDAVQVSKSTKKK